MLSIFLEPGMSQLFGFVASHTSAVSLYASVDIAGYIKAMLNSVKDAEECDATDAPFC